MRRAREAGTMVVRSEENGTRTRNTNCDDAFEVFVTALSQDQMPEDLREIRMLRDLGARLLSGADNADLYRDILAVAMTLTRADAGTVQLLDESSQALVIVATVGFPASVSEHFARVDASSHTSCGIALACNERSFVHFDAPGWQADEAMRLHVESGYRTGQSTPLVSQDGVPIGMVSTHWRASAHRPTERELEWLDLLASQAANLIALRRSEQSLRESREQ